MVQFSGAASIGGHGATKRVTTPNGGVSTALLLLCLSLPLAKLLKGRSRVNRRLTLVIAHHEDDDRFRGKRSEAKEKGSGQGNKPSVVHPSTFG
jgi:hypothetical protein